jgi:hypothetical protein
VSDIVVVADRSSGLRPAISANGAGQFVVAWQNATGTRLEGRLFSADGAVTGEPFLIAQGADGVEPVGLALAALVGGRGFAALWQAGSDLFIAPFRPSGEGDGPPLQINATPVRPGVAPGLVRLADGRLMAVWMAADSREGVRARLCSGDAAPEGPEFTVSGNGAVKAGPIAAAALNGSGVAVGWCEGENDVDAGSRLMLAVIDLDGSFIMPAFVPDLVGFNGVLAIAPILPTDLDQRPGQFALIAGGRRDADNQVLSASVVVAGGDTAIAPGSVTHAADETRAHRPAAAMLPRGFVVAWAETKNPDLGDPTRENVKARVFGGDGTAVQGALDVSTGPGIQSSPAIAVITSEFGAVRTGVAWVDLQPDAPAGTIQARILENLAGPA